MFANVISAPSLSRTLATAYYREKFVRVTFVTDR